MAAKKTDEVDIEEKEVLDSTSSTAPASQSGLSLLATIGLLFGENVPLAILSVPWSYSQLGFVGGVLTNLLVGSVNLYTSLTLWRYCLAHPEQRSVADIGAHLFSWHGKPSRFGWCLGLFLLLINNVFIMGFHTLTGSEIINTLAYHPGNAWCTVALAVFIALVSLLGSLPRHFAHVGAMGICSSLCMITCVLLTLIFVGRQHQHPASLEPGEPVHLTAVAPKGTSFVDGTNALLNIVFLWVGQIVYPSFIAEMREPRDFNKALYALTAFELVVFSGVGAFIYAFAGQYTKQPAVAVIKSETLKKIAFSFALVPTVVIGCIYASATARALFAATLGGGPTDHSSHRAYALWVSILVVLWTIAWVLGNAIPSFGDIVSLTSSLCDSSMGYIFWGLAYLQLHRGQLWKGQSWIRRIQTAFNIFLIPCGLFLLGPGIYTSVQQIINDYNTASKHQPFTCEPNNV